MKEQKFDFLLFLKMKFNKYIRNQKLTLHWGVYKMGQKKFDTNVNKRRKISEKKFSFQMKKTGDV